MRDIFENYLKSHLKVPHETFGRFNSYHDLLLKWQSKINLIGPDTSDIWIRHFLDSIQIAPHIPNLNSSILDFGSGAGFPGMVLAVTGYTNVTLVESDAKKCSFLSEVARITNTKVRIIASRIESVESQPYDFIISRACSELNQLLSYAHPSVSHGTKCLFHKGKNYSKEVEGASENWVFDYQIIPSITDKQGAILDISNLKRRMDL